METEEERRGRLENDAAAKRLRLVMATDEERKARLEKMVATAQRCGRCGLWFLSLKPNSENLATMLIIQT